MAAVKIAQAAMTATIQIGDLDRVTRRKLKVAKTTNGRRIKPIVMSIGIGGMAQSLPQSRRLHVSCWYPLDHCDIMTIYRRAGSA